MKSSKQKNTGLGLGGLLSQQSARCTYKHRILGLDSQYARESQRQQHAFVIPAQKHGDGQTGNLIGEIQIKAEGRDLASKINVENKRGRHPMLTSGLPGHTWERTM